ncbi:MAG: ABC transporter ATP-binding protein [Bacteroidales bacterium]
MIKTVDLYKYYRATDVETTALHHVNLDVKAGEFIAIMGPSGCGKSTLLNILGMLDKPGKGRYFFEGVETSALKEAKLSDLRKGKVGFVFQHFNLIDELTVYENVEQPLVYLRMKGRERKARAEKILERMKMGHRRAHFPRQLSGGQKQRVALCRAVVASPKLILADEPTGNLDSKNGIEVMHLLRELNQEGTTIVMVTHSSRDAEFAHGVVKLFDGKIVGN